VASDGGGHEGSVYFKALGTLRTEVEYLADQGVLLRDPETGLVDFPTEIGGERVFLCWRADEDRVLARIRTDPPARETPSTSTSAPCGNSTPATSRSHGAHDHRGHIYPCPTRRTDSRKLCQNQFSDAVDKGCPLLYLCGARHIHSSS
jgi:hypothetical protein